MTALTAAKPVGVGLTQKLRDCANGIGDFKTDRGDFGLCDDAADRLEALEAEIERLREALKWICRLAAMPDGALDEDWNAAIDNGLIVLGEQASNLLKPATLGGER